MRGMCVPSTCDWRSMVGMQNAELELKYKGCYARILDSKRRFLEAATRYYDLSQAPSQGEPGVQVRLSSETSV